jgi:fatty-acyl-CoA synthase
VAESVGLAVADVVRVPAGTIPKTTSGKLRRQETRRRYLAGELGR